MIRSAGVLLLWGASALAQDTTSVIPNLPVGSRIRVETNAIYGRTVSGPLFGANQGYIATGVGANAVMLIPWSRVASLSEARGREKTFGATKGALAGLGASLIAYPALSKSDGSQAAARLVSFGILPATGALIGWLNAPHRWQAVEWRPPSDTVMESEATRLRLPDNTELLVRSGRRQIRGRVATITDDSLVIRRGDRPAEFAWEQVAELRVRAGRSRARGAALGFSALAVASGVAIALDPPEAAARKRDLILGNMLVGGIVGALVGAPGWSRIPVPAR